MRVCVREKERERVDTYSKCVFACTNQKWWFSSFHGIYHHTEKPAWFQSIPSDSPHQKFQFPWKSRVYFQRFQHVVARIWIIWCSENTSISVSSSLVHSETSFRWIQQARAELTETVNEPKSPQTMSQCVRVRTHTDTRTQAPLQAGPWLFLLTRWVHFTAVNPTNKVWTLHSHQPWCTLRSMTLKCTRVLFTTEHKGNCISFHKKSSCL